MEESNKCEWVVNFYVGFTTVRRRPFSILRSVYAPRPPWARERGGGVLPSVAVWPVATAPAPTRHWNGRRLRWSWCRGSGAARRTTAAATETANSRCCRIRRRPRCPAVGDWAWPPRRPRTLPPPQPPPSPQPPSPGTGPGRCASNGWAWPRSCIQLLYRQGT